jgi:hypothetical protein
MPQNWMFSRNFIEMIDVEVILQIKTLLKNVIIFHFYELINWWIF